MSACVALVKPVFIAPVFQEAIDEAKMDVIEQFILLDIGAY